MSGPSVVGGARRRCACFHRHRPAAGGSRADQYGHTPPSGSKPARQRGESALRGRPTADAGCTPPRAWTSARSWRGSPRAST